MSSFEEYFYRNIANQIRKYRIEKGFSQEELSYKLSKNLKYIGHVERCERKISNTAIIQLLDMWQITPADFYPAGLWPCPLFLWEWTPKMQ